MSPENKVQFTNTVQSLSPLNERSSGFVINPTVTKPHDFILGLQTAIDQIDFAGQQKLVAALRDVYLYPNEVGSVRLIETHISWVLIAGGYAYKIKKALNLGFLDFSNLQARHFYCQEEIRLNQRLAADIYVDVVAIGGEPEAPEIGNLPAIEYAVRMNRFSPENQLDNLLARDDVSPQLIDGLAVTLAEFHRNLPPANNDSAYGTPASIRAISRENFDQLRLLLSEKSDYDTFDNIYKISENALIEQEKYFDQRQKQGFIRECHGDLHLGNIVLIGSKLVPFDGIEFSPALRWIDVIDEVAFLVMDLLSINRPDIAFRFLNSYLEQTGDYAGLTILPFYIAYRAEVRAMICALRASQSEPMDNVYKQNLEAFRRYLALAMKSLSKHYPSLIITHGLPGSGKSTFSQSAAERYQAIRIRSDVERKRLFGLKPVEDSHSNSDLDIYSTEATRQTYRQLHDLAHKVLSAGYSVIVDAAFLQFTEREQFQQLANCMSVPFIILSIKATTSTLKSRIIHRGKIANDPSEANLAVLDMLQSSQELLRPHELEKTVEFLNENEGISSDNPIWSRIDKLIET